MMADFEKTLLPFENVVQPRVADVTLNVRALPARGARGHARPLHAGQPQHAAHRRAAPAVGREPAAGRASPSPAPRVKTDYPRFHYRIYQLATPMQPGEQRMLGFTTTLEQRGFANGRPLTAVVRQRQLRQQLADHALGRLRAPGPAGGARQAPQVRPAGRAAAAQAGGRVGAPVQRVHARQRLGDVRHHRHHRRRPDADRAGPDAQRHRPDQAIATRAAPCTSAATRRSTSSSRSSRAATTSAARCGTRRRGRPAGARRRPGGVLRARPRVQRRPHARRDGRVARAVQQGASRPTSSSRRASSSSRPTPRSRSRSPTRSRSRRASASSSTSTRPDQDRRRHLRDGARDRPPVVGPPAGAVRPAGRLDAGGDLRAVLGAAGDGAALRQGPGAPLPEVRARSLPALARRRRAGGTAAGPRRGPGLHLLPQGLGGDVLGQGGAGRGRGQPRDAQAAGAVRVQGRAVRQHHRLPEAAARRGRPGQRAGHHRPVREDHAARPEGHQRHRHASCPTASTR